MKYVIFGSGGVAQELVDFLQQDQHEITAVVSKTPFNDERYNNLNIIEKISIGEFPGSKFLLAVGEIKYKKLIVQENEDRWDTYVHRNAFVSKYATIGRGSLLYPFSCVLGKSKIGKFTTLNVHCTIPHDNITGDYCTFSPYSAIMGHCNIGDECFFGVSSYCIPKVTLPAFTKVSAGAIVRKSINEPTTLYGDPAAPRKER